MIRRALPGTLAVLVLAVGGCGVRPTEVMDGGQAAVGIASGPTLYFTDKPAARNPKLIPVPTVNGRLGTVADAVNLLLAGPTDEQYRNGIHTEVWPDQPTVGTGVLASVTDSVVELPELYTKLSEIGVDQVVCTAAAARLAGGARGPVTIEVTYGLGRKGTQRSGPRTCPLFK